MSESQGDKPFENFAAMCKENAIEVSEKLYKIASEVGKEVVKQVHNLTDNLH